jgi:hypothetical protein
MMRNTLPPLAYVLLSPSAAQHLLVSSSMIAQFLALAQILQEKVSYLPEELRRARFITLPAKPCIARA